MYPMKVIVTGATGMVGKGVLLECLDHKDITEVLSISRKPLGFTHPKLKELLHADFSEFQSVKDQLNGYDACYACMGVTSAGMKEEAYTKLTYDFTLSLAKTLYSINPQMTFTYVSGMGTDSTEKGKVMWARVKGKTENDLLHLGFKQAFMYRPGAIIPKRSITPSGKLYKNLIFFIKWLLYVYKAIAPKSVVNTTQIGLSMIQVSLNGYSKLVLDPSDILSTSKEN